MIAKSSAHYQRQFRKRLREQGLVKKEVWILPEHAGRLREVEKLLRTPGIAKSLDGGVLMDTNWTTPSLYEALCSDPLITSGNATIELIDGVESALHLVMREFGDLPVFITVAGEQIIVESMLWSIDELKDAAAFNETVLRTHKYFPLSTISLDRLEDGGDFYHMFGSLAAQSSLQNVVYEIEVLASNVIQATEAYSEYLSVPVIGSD